MKEFIEAGRLCSPRGIKGEVRFDCWCDSPEFLRAVKRFYLDAKGERYLNVVLYRPSVPSIIFEGYEDRTSASALAGRTVYFNRNDVKLEDGVYFNDDLISAPVFDAITKKQLGTLKAIEENAAGFYYIVSGVDEESGKAVEYCIPYNDFFVKSVSPNRIEVELIDGLADGADKAKGLSENK